MNRDTLLLYAVTDRGENVGESFFDKIEAALKGGITMLQLREKSMELDDLIAEAMIVKKLCDKYDVPLIINDNVDAALLCGADGVHVGIEDIPVREIRKKAPKGFIIGATAKTVEQAKTAEIEGADYLGVGAVFPSPTKKNAVRITVEELQRITSSVNVPAVAIGGITLENMMEIKDGGMCGIAVVSAIFSANDIEEKTKQLMIKAKELIK